MLSDTTHRLHISVDGQQREIAHLNANQTRVLVGVPINLQNKNDQIISLFDEKINDYVGKLGASNLMPYNIIFEYQHYWWPSLRYPAPVLSFTKDSNILAKLHTALLPKLGVMKMFPIALRSMPVYLGGLNLQSIEVEAIAQAIHHLISLYTADMPTKLLLKIIIEYHQLELGTDTQLFFLSYASFGALATSIWITILWQYTCSFHLLITLPPLQMRIVKQEGDDFINEVALRLNFLVN